MKNEIVLHNGTSITAEQLGIKPRKPLSDLLKGLKVQDKVDKVLIVLLDGSGSMSDIMEHSTKIRVAWHVLRTELMPNMMGWSYGVVLFHGFSVSEWIVRPSQGTKALVIANPLADGDTPMGKALADAWNWVKSNAKQARFILLSDGLPTDTTKGAILKLAEVNNSIPIDTVGIGEGSYSYDPVFLAELSRLTGGMFVEVSSIKMLTEAILRLAPANRPLLGTVTRED